MQTEIDAAKIETFFGKLVRDLGGLSATVMIVLGDRLGLFKGLAGSGPATSEELAERLGLDERYVREWLSGMMANGYLEYDPATGRFHLPAEHAFVLAEEDSPLFFCGMPQLLLDAARRVPDQLVDAFRNGGGVPQSAYGDDFWTGLERLTRITYDHMLVDQWVPGIPGLQDLLDGGAHVSDLGCGAGRALINLAKAFPRSRYVGYDSFAPAIDRARSIAEAEGVSDRVRFHVRDITTGLPEPSDVITTFAVIHDAADPLAILRTVRQSLKADGIYVCLDEKCSDKLEENTDPFAAVNYGASLLYCMTTSLASGGAGLGTLGLHEKKLGELCSEAGFSSLRRIDLPSPFQNLELPLALYDIRP